MTDTMNTYSGSGSNILKESVINIVSSHFKDNIELQPSKLTLFSFGTFFLVVNKDAYTLYQTLGWDFTEFVHNGKVYAFMPVTKDGLCYLRYSMPHKAINIVRKQCDAISRMHFFSLSTAQQMIDMLRFHAGIQELSIPLIRESVLIDGDIAEVVNLKSINISKESMSVTLDAGEVVPIVIRRQWNFQPIGIALLKAVFRIMSEDRDNFILMISNPEKANTLQLSRCKALYAAYLLARKECDSDLLPIISHNEDFITFNDDAITIAEVLHVPLYHCWTDSIGHPAVVVNRSQLSSLIPLGYNYHTIPSMESFKFISLGLTDSILNIKESDNSSFENIIVTKDIAGNYFVKASLCGKPLQRVPIPNRQGHYILSLREKTKERKLLLSAIAFKAYSCCSL